MWTAGKPNSKGSTGYSASGGSYITMSQLHDFHKSLLL